MKAVCTCTHVDEGISKDVPPCIVANPAFGGIGMVKVKSIPIGESGLGLGFPQQNSLYLAVWHQTRVICRSVVLVFL